MSLWLITILLTVADPGFTVRGTLRPDGDRLVIRYPLTGVMARATLSSPPLLFDSYLDMTRAQRIANPTGTATLVVRELRDDKGLACWQVLDIRR
jgi:hypothetical protein